MFNFAWPWLLLILPLPLLVRWLLPPFSTRSAAIKIPFFNALRTTIGSSRWHFSNATNLGRLILASLIWILLVLAAAGPQWLGKPINLPRKGRNIMLAVDLSGSMATPDMTWHGKPATRLQVVKQVADRFIQQRVGDRLGLILFGTRAYLQTPLTFDRTTVQQMLNDATVGLAGPRTAIGDAVGLAIKRLQHYPNDSRVLILLTDGGNNSGHVLPIDAAKVAAKEHIRIYTVGLGAERMVVQGIFGPQVVNPSAGLDEKMLQAVAKITGGLYFRAKNPQDLAHVYHSLDQLEPIASGKATYRPITQLYPWPLGLAFLLVLLALAGSYFRSFSGLQYKRRF